MDMAINMINLDKAFGSFHRLRNCLQSPRFVLTDAGSHSLATLAPELDDDIATLALKRQFSCSSVDSRELVHLDTTIHRKLPLVSTIHSANEDLTSIIDQASSPKEVVGLIQDKVMAILYLLAHHVGSITILRRRGVLQHCSCDDHLKDHHYHLPWSTPSL